LLKTAGISAGGVKETRVTISSPSLDAERVALVTGKNKQKVTVWLLHPNHYEVIGVDDLRT
jgi:hypothetical protein